MIASKGSPLRVWASCGSIFTALASVCAGCAEQPRIDAALDSGVLAFDGGDVSDAAAVADVDAHATATDAGSVDPGLTFEGLTTSARVAFDVDEPVLGVQLLLEGPSGEVGLSSVDASTTAVISDFAFVDAPYAHSKINRKLLDGRSTHAR